MKKRLFQILSLFLILAMLLPLAVACNDEPPANEGGGEGSGEGGSGEGGGSGSGEGGSGATETKISTVEASLKEKKLTPIADFTDPALLDFSGNNTNAFKIKEKITYEHGEATLAHTVSDGGRSIIALPETVNIISSSMVEFTVYSPAASGAKINVTFPPCAASIPVTLDFVGKRTYTAMLSEITVLNPKPNIREVFISTESGEGMAYFGSFYAVEYVYEAVVPEGVDLTSDEPWKKVIENYKIAALGNPESNSEDYKARVRSVSARGKSLWDEFKATYVDATTPNTLFYDAEKFKNNSLNERVMFFYQYVNDMAYAYAVKGGDYYENKELLADILLALEHGYNCYYGKYIVETHRTSPESTTDWYHWDIPIPRALIQTLMLIEDEISRDLIMKYLEPFRIICYYPDGMSGNKLMMSYNVIFASILERDAVRLVQAKELLYDEFFYQDRPEDPTVMRIGDGGAYTDGSYVQHHNIAYTGVYGMTMIQNISSILYITNGTVFDLNKDRVSILFEWIFNNYNSVIYEGHYMPSLIGRNINGTNSKGVSDTDVTINLINEIIVASTYAPAEWKGKMISLIKYYFNLFDDINFAMKAPISLIDYCNEIYADDTIVPWTQPIQTKLYPIMARVLHSGPKYGVSISLSSTYIGKYESFGTTNNAGWYHGDGMIYIHAHDYDFDENFFWWANPYLMPGVTANTAERVAKSVSSPTMVNYSPFVGGVSQGKYGIVGYVFGNADSVFRSGTYKEEKDAKLRANKSYFFFDNEVVCIGTGINDFSDDDVITVVENRYWSESDVLYIDGEVISSPATAQTTISARTMHFSNMGGYVFLRSDKNYDGASITYAKKTNAVNSLIENSQINLDHVRKIKKDFLEIVINHGKGDGNVENNKYFYAYLPESTVEETQTYSANPDVELLTYLDDIHAVIEKDLGIVAANIFVEGSTKSVSVASKFHGYTNVRSISADGPCSVMISKNEAGETVITVSDPTQIYRQNNIFIEIEGVSQVVSADSRITATANGGYVNIRVNTEGANGQSLTLIVK